MIVEKKEDGILFPSLVLSSCGVRKLEMSRYFHVYHLILGIQIFYLCLVAIYIYIVYNFFLLKILLGIELYMNSMCSW